jgi:hypothetical protein
VAANRKYKDSVFNSYFSDKEKLIEVYNVIENANYTKDTEVTINTIQDALFMDRVNDISFLLDKKLIVLIEHQSTVNENMPLRLLMYISRLYEKIVDERSVYKRNRINIPKPNFIVLYNGDEDYPDSDILKLSDAFEDVSIPNLLELEVRVYNINKGGNKEILQKSKSLGEYATFIARVKKNKASGMNLDSAISEAIEYCISEGVMKLSNAFEKEDTPNLLELEVRVYNINRGRNSEIVQKSKSLNEYSTFMDVIKTNKSKGMSLEDAVSEAVKYCTKEDIMKTDGIDRIPSIQQHTFKVPVSKVKIYAT